MIRYALRCTNDHGFESWFRSALEFERLVAAGHVACPDCGVAQVGKALMAPQVRPARNAGGSGGGAERPVENVDGAVAPPAGLLSAPADEREAALAALRRFVEEKSENVGLRFAAEARRIHAGEAPSRMIHGEARPEEARALLEEGVQVAPLPFVSGNKVN